MERVLLDTERELERLQAEQLTMRPIVEAMADGPLVRHPTRPIYTCPQCNATVDITHTSVPVLPWAHAHIQHAQHCPVLAARAIITRSICP